MDKEIIEIIDTSVKIGLGALITGISAYLLNRQNHNHELIKVDNTELRITVKEMVASIEKAETFINRFTVALNNRELDLEHLINAQHEVYQARGLSHLISNPIISKKVDEYAVHIESIYQLVSSEQPNLIDISIKFRQVSNYRDAIYNLINL